MPVALLRRPAILPASGPPQAPPVPVAITFSPSAPIILDNAPAGTLVSTISVTMSPVALFSGTLGFAAPFNNDGGLFTISGSNLIVATSPPTGNSSQNVTISATQNGVTITRNLTITVQQHSALSVTLEDLTTPVTLEDTTTGVTTE